MHIRAFTLAAFVVLAALGSTFPRGVHLQYAPLVQPSDDVAFLASVFRGSHYT